MSLSREGIPSEKQIDQVTPHDSVMNSGPVVIFECFEEIPCDPCFTACPTEAVAEFADINDIPEIDHSACTACGLCIAACPGLAVFIVDMSLPGDNAVVRIPYELVPLPEQGEQVIALDRSGKEVGTASVLRVQKGRGNATPIVWLEVPKDVAMEVRHFRMERSNGERE